MGACSSRNLRTTPYAAYAQTNSRSQVHEVALMPVTAPNFPSKDCPGFTRLHEIYASCPRVRQHFGSTDEVLERSEFYQQVVIDASSDKVAPGSTIPVVVLSRWRGDAAWDVAGFIGCRGFASGGSTMPVNQMQMFFKDGHKVPLTMPAIQLAMRMYFEMHIECANELGRSDVQWPTNAEWTIKRTNMEVRRVLETLLVFWGLRPTRSGSSHAVFPLELRSETESAVTFGTTERDAIRSVASDIALWGNTQTTWRTGLPNASPGLGVFMPSNVRCLCTTLSMNFRGTQQKTPAERREVLGERVADLLELIQPPPRPEGEEPPVRQPKSVRRTAADASPARTGQVSAPFLAPQGMQFQPMQPAQQMQPPQQQFVFVQQPNGMLQAVPIAMMQPAMPQHVQQFQPMNQQMQPQQQPQYVMVPAQSTGDVPMFQEAPAQQDLGAMLRGFQKVFAPS